MRASTARHVARYVTSVIWPSTAPSRHAAPPASIVPRRRLAQLARKPSQTLASLPQVALGLLDDRSLSIELPTGEVTSFDYLWLRDHCREPRSYHPATKQRLVDTYLLPPNLKPQAVETSAEGLSVTWPASSGSGEAYTSFYPWSFLLQHSYEPALAGRAYEAPDRKVLWTSEIKHDMPTVEYDEVMGSEKGVYEWVRRIATYGFSLVSGIPPTPEATEQLIRRIAFVRETHYGGFWVFEPVMEHGDLAYSDVLLQAHTDTTYFTDSCGLQLFHLLSPASSHTGGHNLLVDGFRAAATFRAQHPGYYGLLSSLPIPAHASGTGSKSLPSGVHMRPLVAQPVFNHDERGELAQVRWNGDDRGVVGGEGWDQRRMRQWFDALRAWEAVLRSEDAQLWSVMEQGTAIIFDNHRVLHGRSGFKGERRLCGAYVNHDDYRSRLVGLEKQFGGAAEAERERRVKLLEKYGLKPATVAEERGAWSDYVV